MPAPAMAKARKTRHQNRTETVQCGRGSSIPAGIAAEQAGAKNPAGSGSATAFDLELGEGFLEGGLDGGVFFALELFLAHGGFGAAHGGFGGVLVDVVLVDGHVGEDGDFVGSDFDEAAADGEVGGAAVVLHGEFAGLDLDDETDVVGQDAEFAVGARDDDVLDLAREGDAFRSDDIELERHGG